MKRFCIFFLLTAAICLFIFPSFGYFDGYSINPDVDWADVPAYDPSYPFLFYPSVLYGSSELPSDGEISDISIMPLYNLDSGNTPINTGLRSLMRSIIGNYSPVVVQYQYTNGSNTAYLREILPDYEWMFNFALFSLVVYCIFRMGGGLLWRL